jgi:predicted HAD superfamily Cof-like phosphohydrolase
MSTDLIEMWHQRARPNPVQRDFDVQLGCHFEEICEMLAVVNTTHNDTLVRARAALAWLADGLKKGNIAAEITDRKEFLDAVADQVVTGIGAAHCAHMKPTEAVYRVNRSNWSKYDVDGQPIFDDNGKVKKGPNYAPPDLTGLY